MDILKNINRKRLSDCFARLVSIDAPSFGERAMADYLTKRFGSLGFEVEEDEAGSAIGGNAGNLLVRLPGKGHLSDSDPIIISGHMDTVEPSRGKKAVFHPDGRITSAGDTVLGADDAAALAAMLEMTEVLVETDIDRRPVELLIAAAEEPYCRGSAEFDYSRLRSKAAYIFDLSGEMGYAAYTAPTIISFSTELTGKASHAGFAPEEGISAIAAASLAISRLECGRRGNATLNIGTITGGVQNNIVPDKCIVTGEIRCFDDERAMRLLEQTRDIFATAAWEYKAEARFGFTKHITAYRSDTEGVNAGRLSRAAEAAGCGMTFIETYGGSDGNVISLHGIESFVVSSAMNACHTCEEYSFVDDLIKTAELMLALTQMEE